MFCGKCGAEVASGKFCPRCGSPLNIPAPVTEDEATVLAENNAFSDEPTAVVADDATVMAYDDATVAARDFDATVAAPVYGMGEAVSNAATPPVMPLDSKAAKKAKKAEKKANKKPMSTKKKVLVAISSILAFVIVLGSVAVGVVAFTPKYKFMLALHNTLLNTKSFEFDAKIEDGGYYDYKEMMGEDYSGYHEYYNDTIINGAIAFGNETADTSLYAVVEQTYGSEGWESYYDSDYHNGYEYGEGYYDYENDIWWGEDDSYEDSWDYNDFRTSYVVSNAGEAIAGYLYGEDNMAEHGTFIAGNIKTLADYGENNFDKILREFDRTPSKIRNEFKDITSVEVETAIGWAKTLVSDKKVNENVIEEVFNSVVKELIKKEFNAEIIDYKEVKKLLVDFWLKGLDEEAVKIENSRIEDGMTKYDITIDAYEAVQCFIEYIEKNKELEEFINDIDRDIIRELKRIDKDDFNDDELNFKFTLGTKNMRFVYFAYEYEEDNGVSEYSLNIEVNLKNINKKIDFSGYYNDIKAIADDWKENYHYIKDEQDIINF